MRAVLDKDGHLLHLAIILDQYQQKHPEWKVVCFFSRHISPRILAESFDVSEQPLLFLEVQGHGFNQNGRRKQNPKMDNAGCLAKHCEEQISKHTSNLSGSKLLSGTGPLKGTQPLKSWTKAHVPKHNFQTMRTTTCRVLPIHKNHTYHQ